MQRDKLTSTRVLQNMRKASKKEVICFKQVAISTTRVSFWSHLPFSGPFPSTCSLLPVAVKITLRQVHESCFLSWVRYTRESVGSFEKSDAWVPPWDPGLGVWAWSGRQGFKKATPLILPSSGLNRCSKLNPGWQFGPEGTAVCAKARPPLPNVSTVRVWLPVIRGKYELRSDIELFLKADGQRATRNNDAFVEVRQGFKATTLPNILQKPVLLVFYYRTKGITDPIAEFWM